ncbi:hypothetical protein R4P64_13845 [Rhodococcus sp. IEGM 1366]|uniref:hypothetical protein n=1 Tax=Rhodococcus sp. IEGM 1366 TaxID=3082223 RepID=UPI002953D6AF|nr:hypothetical protein [Rhodococcus sp. IEGM 1366]MDV8067593.1 hypothetical protein [Rhodococcus sp. IEGM 1366]
MIPTMTLPVPDSLDGPAWQRLCYRMLRQHHGAKLVEVPDTVGGDAGLDAFTTDGIVYQSYSPQEPLTPKVRYEKQRDKMTVDIGKFIKNQEKISRLFGPTVVINHWVLLVPRIDDRRLFEHALASQTPRIREEKLPYAGNSIVVTAETPTAYEAAYRSIVENRLADLHLPSPRKPDFAAINSTDVQILKDKLQKVPLVSANGAYREKLVNQLLSSYIAGQDHRAWMSDHLTEMEADLDDQFDELEALLESEYPLDGDAPEALLKRVLNEARERITTVAPNVKPKDRTIIAQGQVADWLMRCPLNFIGPEDNSE